MVDVEIWPEDVVIDLGAIRSQELMRPDLALRVFTQMGLMQRVTNCGSRCEIQIGQQNSQLI